MATSYKATFTRNVGKLIENELFLRQQWLQRMLDPRRNIDIECGHPDTLTPLDFLLAFKRGDIAKRVISIYPDETWSQPPEVYENEDEAKTDFELAWEELNDQIHLKAFLQRIDVLSGIGRFGVLLLGVSDGLPLDQPIAGLDERGIMTGQPAELELLYLRPFDETVLSINELQVDTSNPRCGQPVSYNINFADGISTTGQTQQTVKVHWSRIVHVADNRISSEVYGQPRLELVMNRLLDLKKVAGGSGEMFWKGGFPGISLQSYPNLDPANIEFDKEKTKEEMEAYMNGLKRYIASIGMDAKSLTTNVADPTPHCNLQILLVATAMGVPWRIFAGSEQAQLASEQDTANWNKRLTRRREDYVNPFLLRPFIDRLISIGILPQPVAPGSQRKSSRQPKIRQNFPYKIYWPDPHTPGDTEKSQVALNRTNALKNYVQSGADTLVPPFHYLTLILGMTDEEANSIISAAEDQQHELSSAEDLPDSPGRAGQLATVPPPAAPGGNPAFNGHRK